MASGASQHQREQRLLAEKNERLEKRVLELESSSLFTSKVQQLESMQTDILLPLQDNLKRLQSENSNLQAEISTRESAMRALQNDISEYQVQIDQLKTAKRFLETDNAGHQLQIFQCDAKISKCIDEIEAMRNEVVQLPIVKAELEVAYAACQKHMMNSELFKQQITALQTTLDRVTLEASETQARLTLNMHEAAAASQQKLVSLAAHSERQDACIAAAEQQTQSKAEELGLALGQIAVLEEDCAKLSEANESYQKWKQETEAWSIQAIAALESKNVVVEGEIFSIFIVF